MKKSIISIVLGIITLLTLVGCEADKVTKIDIVSFQEIGGQLTSREALLILEANIPNGASDAEVDSARQDYMAEWKQGNPGYLVIGKGYQRNTWDKREYKVREFVYHIKSVK